MDAHRKLAFVAHMTDRALNHAASTPNTMSPKGSMSHEKMMSFVASMAKNGLQHFDSGGTALSGPTQSGASSNNQSTGLGPAIDSLLGLNNNYKAQGAQIQAGTNAAQLNNSYNGVQSALGTQGQIAGTLNTGLNQGAGNQASLADMYLAQANGQGPNPAQAALNQQTGQNIAQQAALMAGQRGGGANAGLLAAEAARQGAATQQQAVGQGATLQAQQQIAAQGNLQNLSASQIAQGSSATQGLNNAQQNEQNILQGSNTALNNANVGIQSNINNVDAGISTANQNASGNAITGLGNAASAVLPFAAAAFLSKGGMVRPKGYADGGVVGQQTSGPQSYAGQWLNSSAESGGPLQVAPTNFNTNIANPFSAINAPKMPKPGGPNNLEGFDVNQAVAANPATGAADLPSVSMPGEMMAAKGGNVKPQAAGEAAMVKGNSQKNDKIPAMLSEGEIVIPRSITMGKMAPEKAAAFVAHELAKRARR